MDFLAAMIRGAERDILGEVDIAGHGTRRLKTEVWSAVQIPDMSQNDQAEVISEVQNMETITNTLSQDIHADEVQELRQSILRKAFAGEL